MEDQLERFRKEFPEIFPDGAPACGFYLPEAWEKIVWTLCGSLIAGSTLYRGPVPICSQVKDKFGGLRFYHDWPEGTAPSQMLRASAQGMITMAERMVWQLEGGV